MASWCGRWNPRRKGAAGEAGEEDEAEEGDEANSRAAEEGAWEAGSAAAAEEVGSEAPSLNSSTRTTEVRALMLAEEEATERTLAPTPRKAAGTRRRGRTSKRDGGGPSFRRVVEVNRLRVDVVAKQLELLNAAPTLKPTKQSQSSF